MEPVKLGVIGCGVIGGSHMGNAENSDLLELVAIADVRQEALEKRAEAYEVETTYNSGLALLDDENVEAVVLALPTCHRLELALAAFKKGKHVLIEKPIAMNAAEVEQMIAGKGDLVAACCSSRYTFPPSAAATREFVATGALGDIRVVHSRSIRAAGPKPEGPRVPWRLKHAVNGGGIFVNWGCYDLNYLLNIVNWSLKPTVALAAAWQVAPQLAYHAAEGSDAETHIAALIRCEGGAVIQYERAEFAAAEPEDAWRIIGTKGSLRLQMTCVKDKKIIYNTTTPEEGLVSQVVWSGEEESGSIGRGLVEDFALAIREGREPATDLRRSLVLQKITDACYESAATGQAVQIT